MNDLPGTGTPDISVVLATYDRRHSLPRAIASVLAQDGVRFELIVVDDASRDGTADYLATLCDPRVRTIAAQRNRGPPRGHPPRPPGPPPPPLVAPPKDHRFF